MSTHAPPRIAAVVLAAGASTRLGSPKQLVSFRGETLVGHAARSAIDAGASPVFVVVGAHAPLVEASLVWLGVTIVPNDAWATGLASSLAAGVRAALRDETIDAVLVMLADQPLVDAAAVRRLIDACPGPHGVVASAYDDTLGVPAIFARAHASELLGLRGDTGAGRWLRARGERVTRVVMPEAALDVDSPADLMRLD